MKRMARLAVVGAFLAVISLAMAPAAQAYTVSYGPVSIGSTLTDWTGGSLQHLTFPQFNPSLGTLTSVTLDLSGGLDTVLTITNTSPEASNGHAETHMHIFVTGSGVNTSDIAMYSPNFNYNLLAGGSVNSGTLSQTGTDSDVYTAAALLTAFTGGSNIVLDASTFTETVLTNNGGNTAADQVTSANLAGTVTYDYTPEPATMALLGLGAVGMWMKKRRSR
jgi:hypothetical protein